MVSYLFSIFNILLQFLFILRIYLILFSLYCTIKMVIKMRKEETKKRIEKQKEETKRKARKTVEDYKSFAMKGNVLDMAIGVIIGGALTSIVNALVSSTIMPIISLFTQNVDLSKLFITLRGGHFETLEEATASGALVLNYGQLLNAILNFFIITIILFIVVSFIKKSNRKDALKNAEKKVETKKDCPYCCTSIPIGALRCPNCTTILDDTMIPSNLQTEKEENTTK